MIIGVLKENNRTEIVFENIMSRDDTNFNINLEKRNKN